jgi:hypothetical protein
MTENVEGIPISTPKLPILRISEVGFEVRRAHGKYFNMLMAEGPVFFDTAILVVFDVVCN